MTAVAGSIRPSASKPSALGICTSSRIKSGRCSPASRTASRPSAASPTTSHSGCARRYSRSSLRAGSSSSTTSTVLWGESVTGAPPFCWANRGAPETSPRSSRRRDWPGSRCNRILDLDQEAFVPQCRAHPQRRRLRDARDAVCDGVLDERLQDERRDLAFECRWVELPHDLQALPEPQGFDTQVHLGKLPLLAQADERTLPGTERTAQVGAELDARLPCASGIVANEGAHGVQAIEQEVRMHLGAQGPELCALPRQERAGLALQGHAPRLDG